MDSSLFELSVYCYDISYEVFLQEFMDCVIDSDNTYSVVMDFVIQRKIFLKELKLARQSLDIENLYCDRVTDNTDSYISFVDDDCDMYNLDISYSNSLMDYDLRVQFNISSVLLKVITREPVVIFDYDFHDSLCRSRFNVFEIMNYL